MTAAALEAAGQQARPAGFQLQGTTAYDEDIAEYLRWLREAS